ncbi:MAG: hypothetical protein M3367_02010 [Acidobacteriota bacterium]|nr:hypothetical protein [Acidobacteriota bacterium]
MNEKIQICLSKDEAIILFEFLSRFSEKEVLEIADQSEERVLLNVLCDLEKTLVEPFVANYQKILKKSRERIRDGI